LFFVCFRDDAGKMTTEYAMPNGMAFVFLFFDKGKQVKKFNPFNLNLRLARFASLILAILSLSAMDGCAAFSPTDPYAGMSSRIRPAMTENAAPSETQTAGLPQSIRGEITLEQALDMALANNPDLAAVSLSTRKRRPWWTGFGRKSGCRASRRRWCGKKM